MNELKQIIKEKDLEGKTITKVYKDDELWLRFSDDSFAVLKVNDISEPYGYTRTEVSVEDYFKGKSDYSLVELGLVTEKEYHKACKEREIEFQKSHEESERKRKKRLEEREMKELQRLANKYEKKN